MRSLVFTVNSASADSLIAKVMVVEFVSYIGIGMIAKHQNIHHVRRTGHHTICIGLSWLTRVTGIQSVGTNHVYDYIFAAFGNLAAFQTYQSLKHPE